MCREALAAGAGLGSIARPAYLIGFLTRIASFEVVRLMNRVWMSIAVALVVVNTALVARTPSCYGDSPSRSDLARWIRELDANEYAVRDRATEKLIGAGSAAVAPILDAVRLSSWEVSTRAIFVLQQLALSGDLETEQAAIDALDGLVAADDARLVRRATEALERLALLRRKRGLEILTQLGAVYDPNHQERDMYGGTKVLLEIGPQWLGTVSDLRHLRWLHDVEQVTFAGPQVTDDWIAYLPAMERLEFLKVKRASITDASAKILVQIPRLQKAKFLYVPLTDQSLADLKQCRHMWELKLYGTRITPDGAMQLITALGEGSVDYRRGAFLGISPSDDGPQWFIQSVTPNSAAESAQLQPGDVITRYDGHDVRDFRGLMHLIGQNDVGDTVKIEVLRSGQRFEKEVTFGEWD